MLGRIQATFDRKLVFYRFPFLGSPTFYRTGRVGQGPAGRPGWPPRVGDAATDKRTQSEAFGPRPVLGAVLGGVGTGPEIDLPGRISAGF